MSIEEAHEHRTKILKVITEALYKAFKDKSQDERQLIANLAYYLPSILNRQLSGIFSPYGISFRAGGVFVHGHPYVTTPNFPKPKPRSVEIGDILLLTTLKRGNGTVSRTALLLQAKKSKAPAKPDNPNQHHLYAFWPEFEYVRATPALNRKKRKITGPLLYQGAKYLLVGQATPLFLQRCLNCVSCLCDHCYHLKNIYNSGLTTTQPYLPDLGGYACFICELYDFIFGNAGRPFVYQPPDNNINWDQVITDLMTVTAKRASIYVKRASKGKGLRGQGLFFLAGDLSNSLGGQLNISKSLITRRSKKDGPPEIPLEDFPDEMEDGGGISIVEFTMEETEPESRE